MILLIRCTLIFTSVLVLVALGGMFSERSGIINLGLEGIMVIGALAGAICCQILDKEHVSGFWNFFLSSSVAMVAGVLFSLLLAVACVRFKADQTITGTALNIMSTALAVVMVRKHNKTPASQISYPKEIFNLFPKSEISYFVLLMIVVAVVSYIYLYKTSFGLHHMACGEHPQAADSVGINVYHVRYRGVMFSGILAGLGGFAYVAQSGGNWDFKNGVLGFGFLALAVMIFGQWKPFRILFAAVVFGLSQSIALIYSGQGITYYWIKFSHWHIKFIYGGTLYIPSFIYKMLPYIVCMIVLALTSKHSKAPKAEGQVYEIGESS